MDKKQKIDNLCEEIRQKETLTDEDLLKLIREIITHKNQEQELNKGILITLYGIIKPMIDTNNTNISCSGESRYFKVTLGDLEITWHDYIDYKHNYSGSNPIPTVYITIKNKDKAIELNVSANNIKGNVKKENSNEPKYNFSASYIKPANGLLNSSSYSIQNSPTIIKGPYDEENVEIANKEQGIVINFNYNQMSSSLFPDGKYLDSKTIQYTSPAQMIIPFIPYISENPSLFEETIIKYFPEVYRRTTHRLEKLLMIVLNEPNYNNDLQIQTVYYDGYACEPIYRCAFNISNEIVLHNDNGIFVGTEEEIGRRGSNYLVEAMESENYSMALARKDEKNYSKIHYVLVAENKKIEIEIEIKPLNNVTISIIENDNAIINEGLEFLAKDIREVKADIRRKIYHIVCPNKQNNDIYRKISWDIIVDILNEGLNNAFEIESKAKTRTRKHRE